ncbi:MAG TPA: HAMP domain-containing protein [Clostridiales bacterium]|nr:HAMP domain-containing protein [Clostridiales bacterium]
MRDSSDAVYNTLQEIVKLNLELAKEQFDQNKATAETASITMSIAIVIAIVLAIALGIFVSNSIAKPLRHLVEVANQIAEGNLDVSVGISTKDEIGVLASAFDRMADNLNDLISSINLAAEQVAAGSRQLSESSFALSQGASEQASTIEQLTASLEEISTQTKQNADNSAEADNLAGMAKETALKGNKQMQDMMAAMDEIQKSSRNINNIIKVIDDIAFQTNILALNAAVEAARAGQHGRGFAVVADEVRNLASRSANAAKETTELIETSISNIERGTEIAKKTSDALDKIVEDVTKVASLVENIAVASKEQAAGISQINEGISLVSEVVEKNSATAEESASASEELSSQAQNLKDQIARFKLRQSDAETKKAVVPPKVEKLPDIKPAEQRNGIDKHDEEDDNDTPEIILSDKEFDKY